MDVLFIANILLPTLGSFSSKHALQALFWLGRAELALLLFLGLSPLAITMALVWKTKEVIFDSVFGAK